MSNDVLMHDISPIHPSSPSPSSPTAPPSTSTSHTPSSSHHNDDVEVISLTSRDNSLEPPPHPTIVATANDDIDIDANPILSNNKIKPLSSATASTSAHPASTAAATNPKPKSTKQVRARSRSPSPPPPAPPLQTIRLDIRLGGPDNYEVDIANFAKSTGQRAPTPVPVKRDTSDSEGDDDDDAKERPKKKKKKNLGTEYYDISDPFIDDSELAIDERTYFAQTKQQGFYVSSGEVALLKDKTPKKPKSRKPLTSQPDATASTAGPSTLANTKQETKDMSLSMMVNEEKASKKRKNYTVVEENGKKRKIVDVREFHPELQKAFDDLKAAIAKESWESKGKFPPSLKPILAEVALKAVHLNEYDDDFFNLMPALFPYNRYTMTKLIKRTIFHDHAKLLMSRQESLLEELGNLTKEGFSKAQEEWEKSVVAWEKRQEKLKAEAETGGATPSGDPQPTSHRQSTEDVASGAEGGDATTAGDKDGSGKDGNKESHPPTQRYRMTDSMKVIIWQLVTLSNECCRLENEKNELEGNNAQISEQGLRKVLYQKIVAAFPTNWMNSSQISREVSSMKKRLEREALENES